LLKAAWEVRPGDAMVRFAYPEGGTDPYLVRYYYRFAIAKAGNVCAVCGGDD